MGIATIAWLIPAITSQLSASAQDESCYMVNSAGRRINLGKLCGVGKPKPNASSTKDLYSVPIKRRDGGTPVIDVTFNGSQKFEMLLDTGASGTLITRSMARALQIPIVGAGQFTMADGRTIVMPLGRLNSMSIEGAQVNNVNVAIASDASDGLLGHDFLGNYDIKIKRDVIEFYPR
ncbi:retroviral-like aspartic protease family protein [Phormidium sp. CLA17]|nr:retroviral-like aspartic protease family protein [Leptolyngbya sp. Cla-17]